MRWFTLLLIGCVSVQATAADINVPGIHGPTIQAAIVAANPGDVVIVAPGTYLETIDFLGKAITVRSTDPNDHAVVLSTIIDGNGLGSVVTCATGEGPGSILDGFVITGGSGTVIGANTFGGGMYNLNSNPTVINCSFSLNSVFAANQAFGGGMYNNNSSPRVNNCSFSVNSVSSPNLAAGGGMYNSSSSSLVISCSFNTNSVSSSQTVLTPSAYGGGMYNATSNPTVMNCSFNGNTALATTSTGFAIAWGGGMYNETSGPTVNNCTFSANLVTAVSPPGSSLAQGGGMFILGISGLTIIADSEFCGDAPDHVFGIFSDGGGNEFNLGCPPPINVIAPASCPGDCSGPNGVPDGQVNITDILALLTSWGVCP